MQISHQEIQKYVSSKSGTWTDSTASTAYSKLCTIASCGFKPDSLYQKLETGGYSRYTIKMYFILAQQYEREIKGTAVFKNWMQSNRLKFKNAYKQKDRALTDEHFERFLKLAYNNEIHNFLILLGKAGLRKSEALGLKRRYITDNQLEVHSGKGGKQRFIPFNINWLKDNNEEVVPQNLAYAKFFETCCEGFTPHDFRAYYATKIVNMIGMSIEDARDLLGHNDIKTTVKYLRVNKNRRTKLILENL